MKNNIFIININSRYDEVIVDNLSKIKFTESINTNRQKRLQSSCLFGFDNEEILSFISNKINTFCKFNIYCVVETARDDIIYKRNIKAKNEHFLNVQQQFMFASNELCNLFVSV